MLGRQSFSAQDAITWDQFGSIWGVAAAWHLFALFAFSGLHCLSPLISWLVSSSLPHTFIMSYLPKTPSHRHRSRSETKTPLTPSLASGINALNLGIPRQGSHSPTKGKADVSFNPFLSSRPSSPVKRAQSTSRPASPIKRATTGSLQVSDTLQRQASSGLIRKGGVESRIDVITRDYVPPKTQKRSRSQPNVSRATNDPFDLFVSWCLVAILCFAFRSSLKTCGDVQSRARFFVPRHPCTSVGRPVSWLQRYSYFS